MKPGDPCFTCGAPLTYDALMDGMSCGGLDVVGALVCPAGHSWLENGYTRAADFAGAWKLSGGGRSIDAGSARVRAEKGGVDTLPLMRRIVRVPVMERALRAIADGCKDPVAVAQAALADGSDADGPGPDESR